MLGACIGGAVGGLVGGFFPNEMFWEFATLIIGFEDIVDEDDDLDFVEESNAQLLDNEISITSPLEWESDSFNRSERSNIFASKF